jgi:hypothetical protein
LDARRGSSPIQKSGNKPLFALVSNNIAASRVGLRGGERLTDDLYQFGGSSSSANSAVQAQIGTDFAAGSVDVFYEHKNNAILASSLSAPKQPEPDRLQRTA